MDLQLSKDKVTLANPIVTFDSKENVVEKIYR